MSKGRHGFIMMAIPRPCIEIYCVNDTLELRWEEYCIMKFGAEKSKRGMRCVYRPGNIWVRGRRCEDRGDVGQGMSYKG